MSCQSVESMRHTTSKAVCYEDSLWMFGERRYRGSDGAPSYRSVSVKIENFHYYVFLDVNDMDFEQVQSIVIQLEKDVRRSKRAPTPFVKWDLVRRRRFVGVDYDQFLSTESDPDRSTLESRFQRTYARIYLRNPSSLWNLSKRCESPVVDVRNVPRQLTLYHGRWDWGNLFVHSNGIRLQEWMSVSPASLTRVRDGAQRTHCAEEYVMKWREGCVRSHPAVSGAPYLCATMRTRTAAEQSLRGGSDRLAAADPGCVDGDRLLAVCSDVYWNGHSTTSVVKIRLFAGEDDAGGGVAAGGGSDSGDILLRHRCRDGEHIMRVWRHLISRMDAGVLVYLNDTGDDVLHALLRTPHQNVSRFRDLKCGVRPKRKDPGSFYFSTPGMTLVDVSAYMRKIAVKPKFDSFTILSAYNHPSMYRGPLCDTLSSHNPAHAHALPGHENVRQCGLEAAVLRHLDQGPNILIDAVALSRVCTLSVTGVVRNGQQLRVLMRLQHDVHRAGMIINDELLKLPVCSLPSRTYNSFPTPPELPNVPLRRRGPDFDRVWAEAVRAHPPDPRMRMVRAPPPPDPESLPPTVVMDVPSYQSGAAAADAGAAPRRKTPTGHHVDVFGHTTNARASTKRRNTATPTKPKYGGGLVLKPFPEFYSLPEEITATLDFSSLYPSIIQAEGLCYSLLVWDRRIVDDPRFTVKFVEIVDGDSVVFVTHVDGVPLTGVLPSTEKELVDERKRVKAMEKGARKEIDRIRKSLGLPADITTTQVQSEMEKRDGRLEDLRRLRAAMTDEVNYNKQQLGSKLVQNALFGFTGVERNGKMPCQALMGSITSVGRWMLRLARWYCIRYHKAAVVYGDTDSVMVQVPHLHVPDGPKDTETQRYMQVYWPKFNAIAEELTGLYPPPHDMENECAGSPLWQSDRGKCYASLIWEGPVEAKKIKISGIPFIKRDRCDWVRDVCGPLLTMLIRGHRDDLQSYVSAHLARLSSGRVPIEKLTVSCCLKARDEYKGDGSNLIQVQLADKIRRRTGEYPPPGSRLTYVVVKGSGMQYTRGEPVNHVKRHGLQVDLHHYLKQISPILQLLLMFHKRWVPIDSMLRACSRAISEHSALQKKSSVLSFLSRGSSTSSAAKSPPAPPPSTYTDEQFDQLMDAFDVEDDDEEE